MAQEAKKNEEQPIPLYGKGEVKKPCAVLLWSSLSSNAHQTAAQKRMVDKLKAHKVRMEQLDGSQPENKDARNKLFNKSNVRGKYPQIFIVDEKDELQYIGMDDEIDFLIDSEKFDEVMKSCIG
mmetsp:Transcript_23399/g.37221  ORF Transcript_23399/g.37221 Transcript_23399/m.37221 type:complete len:124 (-) Transcript_23399:146-517(-)|eukprot:CAMPEP_0197057802 /NCGR_PEP_ID=MMETSP1384-20130603/100916_1 /TAXON_ID=29189 /ORGANISM="Ammonia sp." /LENGTH=123 /DNA_ID=CAMNT_0042492341 /DNA_START=287 /DNA_END=658 /DNA_ORIENTATION=-